MQPLSLVLVTMSPSGSDTGSKKKKPIQTKYRMPLLNWQALRSHQVTGTIFHDLDDEMILQVQLLPVFTLGPSMHLHTFSVPLILLRNT